MNELRKTLTNHLVKELGGTDKVKEFSNLLRNLDIVDLRNDNQLKAVTENGLIDTLVVLYMFGTMSKLYEIKTKIKEVTGVENSGTEN